MSHLIQSQIAVELQIAFDVVAKKYGLEPVRVDVRSFRNEAGYRIMKTDLMRQSSISNTRAAYSAVGLESAMKRDGINKKVNAKGDTLLEYRARAPKYPYVYISKGGTRWKQTVAQAQKRFA